MLNKLSANYQKHIAVLFIYIFGLSGLIPAVAGSGRSYPVSYSNDNRPASFFPVQPNDRFNLQASATFSGSNVKTIHAEQTDKKGNPGAGKQHPTVIVLKDPSAKGDIGGPSQPEMASFKSVGADNMVSPFTGDFSYNIPLLDVGGYPVNMFYNSGITMDQDASWVGLGWNINPGTINRNMRGLPDDFDGSDVITKRQSIRPDITWGVSGGAGVKLAGFPLGSLGLNVNAGLSFNNKLGVAAEAGLHPALSLSSKGGDAKTSGLSYGASIGAELDLNSRNGASVTPSISFDITNHDENESHKGSLGVSYTYSSRLGLEGMHLDASYSKSLRTATDGADGETEEKSGTIGALSSHLSFLYPTVVPSIQSIFTRSEYALNFSVGGELGPLFTNAHIAGYYQKSMIAKDDQETYHPAYGILHYENANGDKNAMLDFNRVNDGVYTPASPSIAMPLYTYDIFNVSGEGTGGSFRAYRGDIGFMHDPYVVTRDDNASLGVDLGLGNTVHVGVDFTYASSPTSAGAWQLNNMAAGVLAFQKSHDTYQSSYFKNPGEKTIPDADFQNAIGGESLVRFKMTNIASGTPLLLPNLLKYDAGMNAAGEQPLSPGTVIKNKRDKRTQVISFMTAEEADRTGFDRKIYAYDTDPNKVIYSSGCNNAGITPIDRVDNVTHKRNHISEIDVLGTDGRKYVYGLPVYNTTQREYSFSVNGGDPATGQTSYLGGADNSNNTNGRDWYMQTEVTPAYAHSYLLTALVSPNYVDVTGDGITEDDMGDAVKFNYSKYENFKWRTPDGSMSASYSQGMKTDPQDDKAHYVYGEREKWLLYSIESKNMVARFFAVTDREDGRQVKDSTGGLESGGMLKLDKICLYSKGDLAKFPNGIGAKPIKTIQFFQHYDLCKGVESSNTGNGKLTLDSIWITYNGNMKAAKTRYLFLYPKTTNNPNYYFSANDRWGNYKPASENPVVGGVSLNNNDYPYSTQVQADADRNAAAWTMNEIVIPSGGRIHIDYESDDYAYVQDKRAANMYSILGFGTGENPNLNDPGINRLYNGGSDNNYVYINLPYPITGSTPDEIFRNLTARYFENTSQIYLKLAVTMPSGGNIPGSAGSEIIPVYADIEKYGLVSPTVAFVKVSLLSNGVTPMTQEVLQFLKQQLPGKAFPGYDMSENSGARGIILALAGMISSAGELFDGVDNTLRNADKCSQTVTGGCFARLSNPYFKKLGGGLRVKKVTISDSWNKMTGQYDATYGQEYKYTTTELVNNVPTEISSGVASWEPSVGGDENPHKQVMRFLNHNKGGPYDFGSVETPLGEALYPAPLVGYSRVEVLSIHRNNTKNPPTRQVTEFFTTRDFPFKSSNTSLEDQTANVKYQPSAILQLLHLDMEKSVTQSQGFLVDMNDMNGKEKSQAVYMEADPVNAVSYTRNYYNIEKATDNTYKFNHSFPVLASPQGDLGTAMIGRDIEVMADFREHNSQTITTNISPNFDFFFLGIFPIPLTNLLQPVVYEGTTYRSASLLKIVNHFGMLDSVVSVDKGSMVSTKNLVYDAETGNPLITRTNNEHNKPIYNFNYPAHWSYSGMGGAYKNIDASYTRLNFNHGILMNMPAGMSDVLESGDELYTIAENNSPIVPPPGAGCDANPGTDMWSTLIKNPAKKIWAVNTSKANSTSPQWVFMDQEGYPYNAVNASVRIIRSGHRNMVDQSAGSITSMSYPVNDANKLQFDDNSNIIQASAATFKDHWRVDNAFFFFDSTGIQTTQARIKAAKFNMTESVNCMAPVNNGTAYTLYDGDQYFSVAHNLPYLTERNISYKRTYSWAYDSWIRFNMSSLDPSLASPDAVVVKSKLSLYAHTGANAYGNSGPYEHGLTAYSGSNHSTAWSHLRYLVSNNTTPNDVSILSMRTAWPANDAAWFNVYADVGHNLHNWSQTGYIPAPPTTQSGLDYAQGDNRISIPTATINEMLTNARNPNNNVATAFRLMQTRATPGTEKVNRKEDLSQCFIGVCPGQPYNGFSGDGGNNATPPNSPPQTCKTPVLTILYYKCGDVSMSPTGIDDDPLVNTLLTCNSVIHLFTGCRSKFLERKSVNPYVEGILGNWRVDSTYAYYGERKESAPNTPVDTRTGGTIINFAKFWNFPNSTDAYQYLTRNGGASNVWVWNSTITQYNRKGYEIENKDPLGRFNSGLYGYNQQLPIAVANNARVREVLFDGLEDYGYNTGQNCITCKPHRFFTYDQNVNDFIDASQHHTGNYSLRLNAGQNIAITAPVTDLAAADAGYGLQIKVDETTTQANSMGNGLKAEYYNNLGFIGTPFYTVPDQTPTFSWNANSMPVTGLNHAGFSVRWTGRIKPLATTTYTFQASSFNAVRVFINGTQILSSAWNVIGTPGSGTSTPMTMQAGQFYDITVEYQNWQVNPSSSVLWRSQVPTSVSSTSFQAIPNSVLYSPTNTYTTTNAVCSRLDKVNIEDHALTDTFSLIQGKKMLISTWVKEGGNDCKCSSYVKNSILITYTGTTVSEPAMYPVGSIIEGWQRYEGLFTVPLNATAIKITLRNSTSSAPVYFDDIRVQPFNANMKSFVYNSSNLRLMSELDENNYASFYEYDDDGTLARVKKETVQGIKTITETRSAMQQVVNE